jgi:hypothetical protein
MRRSTLAFASACALAAASTPSLAAQVMLRMEGTITSGAFYTGPFVGAGAGDAVVLEVLFDTSIPDTSQVAGWEAYHNPAAPFTLTVGSYTYSDLAHPTYGSWLGIRHDTNFLNDGLPNDVEDVLTVAFAFPGTYDFLNVFLIDQDATAFDDYTYPDALPSMNEFEFAIGRFIFDDYSDDPFFSVSSVTLTPVGIPLPSASLLAAAGLAGLGLYRRRA